MKVLVVMDSFKGSLTSRQANEAVAKALARRWPEWSVTCVPISDGGEGMVSALLQAHSGRIVRAACHDPLMRSIEASYGIFNPMAQRWNDEDNIEEDTGRSTIDVSGAKSQSVGAVAAIEVAEASGLLLLSPNERNPLLTNTYGTGELIRHALDHGLRRFIVGLGGSATCDAGLGMMQALGAKLLDARGRELTASGAMLEHIARIDLTGLHPALQSAMPMRTSRQPGRAQCIIEDEPRETHGPLSPESSMTLCTDDHGPVRHLVSLGNAAPSGAAIFTVACDVGNPFTGAEGAACVFGPQKGADHAGVEALERGMEHVRRLIMTQTGIDLNCIAGAGAAGGLGGAFVALLGAGLRSGIDLLMDTVGLDELIKQADLIITGEGKADRQTLMGKVPQGLLRRAHPRGVPVVILAGRVEDAELLLKSGFAQVIQVSPTMQPLEEAMWPDVARTNIDQAIAHMNSCGLAAR